MSYLKEDTEYLIGEWRVKPRLLTISNADTEVTFEPLIMKLLVYFCERPGQVITRDELIDAVWGTIVSDSAVARAITKLRKAFGDTRVNSQYFVTLPKTGYRLIQPIKKLSADSGVLNQTQDTRQPSTKETSNHKPHTFLVNWRHYWPLAVIAIAGFAFLQWKKNSNLNGSYNTLTPVTSLKGTERALHLAPQQNLLAFARRADTSDNSNIYSQDLLNNTAQQLTDGTASDSQPAWSHSGRFLAFHRFKANQLCEIRTIDLSLTEDSKLLTNCHPSSYSVDLAWAQDDTKLYFTDGDGFVNQYKIFEYSLNTGKKTQISNPTSSGRGDYRIALSPEKTRLAFLRNNDWYLTQVGTIDMNSKETNIHFEIPLILFDIAWFRNDDELLFRGLTGQLSYYSIPGKRTHPLTALNDDITSPLYLSSEDAILAIEGRMQASDIWLFYNPASNQRAVMAEPLITSSRTDYLGRMSPNGGLVSFVSSRSGKPQVWLRHENGDEQQITSFDHIKSIRQLDWSPNSNQLIVGINGQVGVLNLNNTDLQLISTPSKNINFPTWSANGNDIYYSTEVEGDWQICKMQIPDGKVVQLTQKGGYIAKESPDGKRLFFSKYRQPGIWEFFPTTGEERLIIPNFIDIHRDWYVFNDGIYYSSPHNREISPGSQQRHEILFFDFATDTNQMLLSLAQDYGLDFSVTNERNFLVTQTAHRESRVIKLSRQ